MPVYLNAATLQAAKTLQKQTALQLGQTVDLPYFKVFEQSPLTLPTLYQLIDQHIEQALQQAGWLRKELAHIPIFLGSTGYVIADCEARLANKQPLPSEYSIAVIGEYLRTRYQTEVYSFATSCTSSAQGIHYAYKMLKVGRYKKALVIGFESFNRLTFEHFHSMHLLTQSEDYFPFIESTGMVLGDGLACLALSNESHADFRCELLAVCSLTDTENLTQNSSQALSQLITGILAQGHVSANEIVAIKVHGVGGLFDQAEMQVLQTILPHSQWILAKAYLGHTLGASGAVETAFCIDALLKGSLPKHCQNAAHLPLMQGKLPSGYYLHYFLGFGGSNVGWLMKWETC